MREGKGVLGVWCPLSGSLGPHSTPCKHPSHPYVWSSVSQEALLVRHGDRNWTLTLRWRAQAHLSNEARLICREGAKFRKPIPRSITKRSKKKIRVHKYDGKRCTHQAKIKPPVWPAGRGPGSDSGWSGFLFCKGVCWYAFEGLHLIVGMCTSSSEASCPLSQSAGMSQGRFIETCQGCGGVPASLWHMI